MHKTLLSLLLMSSPILACIAIPREQARQPITLTEQRAFIWREGKKEHMLLSVQYRGASDEFAWVVPVESRPKVEVEGGAPFTELRNLTRLVEPPTVGAAPSVSAARAPGGGVEVLERKEEGPYDLAVLRASDTGGLYDWLKSNGFKLDKNVRGALDSYVTRKFVFVAARMRSGEKNKEELAKRLQEGNIAPIHLTYQARNLSYPLRVTSGNPGWSQMELYVVAPDQKPQPNLSAVTYQLKAQGPKGFAVSGPPNLANPTGQYPTLRRLLGKGGTLVKYTANLPDEKRQQDLIFD